MSLAAVASLARRVATGSWFAAVGEPLTCGERSEAQSYLTGLGLAGPTIDPVADWRQAKALADAPDWDPAWWDAEERTRGALMADAAARHSREAVLDAVSRVAL